ncbi:CRISPR-associated protein [Halococcus salifodinae]|uniref:Crispr-associated protein n=1 Tax=Halococcus salifodinae DSM 8989 TaxID=1227456 RepID=M0NCJ7_9EURY|nr:CRISPR-associated protein [Halococcus salifodinae]EMA54400.1 crispr-associated protein [Halococcus salifodinae DSM 8989]
MQAALRTIGEAIIDDEYTTEYQPYYTASPISGTNKAIESVVVLRFERIGDRMEYRGTELIDLENNPEATATRFGYVSSSGKTDNSVTKRLTQNNPVDERYSALLEWFDEDVLGDELLSDPDIAGVRSILCEPIGATHEQVKQDIDNIAQRVEYRALLTLSITENGQERYVGELTAYNEGMKRWAAEDVRTKSTAKDSYGFARCSICDTETECFGLGAKMGEQYAVKQQWPFLDVNSSEAWRNRPLCMECITAIEVASDRFLEAQDYGVPGIRCRVIPYALPMPAATDQLKALIREARFELTGGDTDNDTARQRPLSTAWENYRHAVETTDQPDVLRLAFSHIIRETTKTHGVAWIDGVSIGQVVALRTALEELYENDPVFEQGLLPKPDPPTEQQLFSGSWVFQLLAGTRGSDHRDQYIGDETPWVEYTERLLTNGPVNYSEVIAVLMREIYARYRDRLDEDTDYPYDGFHLAATYGFLRLASEQGILRDTQTGNNDTDEAAMTMTSLDSSYTSFGDGIRTFVAAHPSIENSPGRTAAFVLGAAAAQLSNWQAYRGLSRTFVQSRNVDQLTAEILTRWQTDIWEKAKIYNQQAGRYGVPWADAESLFHEAVLAGENDSNGWQATAEEIRYHYVLGVNVGPNISQRAQENRDDQTIPETEDEEPVSGPAIEDERSEMNEDSEPGHPATGAEQ